MRVEVTEQRMIQLPYNRLSRLIFKWCLLLQVNSVTGWVKPKEGGTRSAIVKIALVQLNTKLKKA